MSTHERKARQPYHWLGIDVAKAWFDVALFSVANQEVGTPLGALRVAQFPRTPNGVQALLSWQDAQLGPENEAAPTRVVMEATGTYSHELARWLLERAPELVPAIINPQQAAYFIKSFALRNTTDRLAARALALYGAQRRPAPYEPLGPQQAELRELTRYRHRLVEDRTAMSNRAGQGAQNRTVKRMQAKRLRQIDKDIETLEREMRALAAQIDGLGEDIELLQTIHGVGFITAVTVRVELGDLRRFERARQLTAFAGLNPRVVQSGTSIRKRTRMSKAGNQRVRAILYMAACASISRPHPIQAFYLRLKANGKAPKEALGVLMRKLLVLSRAILISGEPYDPYYRICGKHPNKTLENAV